MTQKSIDEVAEVLFDVGVQEDIDAGQPSDYYRQIPSTGSGRAFEVDSFGDIEEGKKEVYRERARAALRLP